MRLGLVQRRKDIGRRGGCAEAMERAEVFSATIVLFFVSMRIPRKGKERCVEEIRPVR